MSGIEYLGFVAGILVVIVFFKREVDDLRKKVEQLQKKLDAMQDSVESLDPVAIGAKPNTEKPDLTLLKKPEKQKAKVPPKILESLQSKPAT